MVFKREAPWATIAHSVVYQPLRKDVVDFKIDPFGAHIFYGVAECVAIASASESAANEVMHFSGPRSGQHRFRAKQTLLN